MTLQAWFDDSGSKGTGRFMSMCGLFGSAEAFASLSDDWARYLPANQPGRISYFKMDEACGLDGEFRDWQEQNRDLKVRQMAGLIDRHDLKEFAAVVDLHAYAKVFPMWAKMRDYDSGKHHSFNQPYMFLFQYVLTAVVQEAVNRGSTSPMEIFFDNQETFKRPILDTYDDLLREERDASYRAVMPAMPWFRDDHEFVVLQAADLLAGEVRVRCEHDLTEQRLPSFFDGLCPSLKQNGHFKLIHEQEMREMHQYTLTKFVNHFTEGGNGNEGL